MAARKLNNHSAMTVGEFILALSDQLKFPFILKLTLQERCCHFRTLRVTLQRKSEIACICAGGVVYFVVNKMSYFFFVSGPGPLLFFACTDSYDAYKMTKYIQNMLEVKNVQ